MSLRELEEPSPGDLERETFFNLNAGRLSELAWRAVFVKNLRRNTFFIICIDYDDPAWRDLADALMPGHDWQSYRDRGERPVARGSVMTSGVGDYLKEVVPAIAAAFDLRLADDQALAVVLAAGGATAKVIPLIPEL